MSNSRHVLPLTPPQKALVESVWPLLLAEASQRKRKAPAHVDYEDLVQVGAEALCRLASRFDPTRGVKFTSYAVTRLRWELFDYCQAEWNSLWNAEQRTGDPSEVVMPIEPIEWKMTMKEWTLLRDVVWHGATDAAKRRRLSTSWLSRQLCVVRKKLEAQGVLE